MKKYIPLLFAWLLASCSSDEPPRSPAEDWLPVVSRSTADGDAPEDYHVSLRYGTTTSSGTLQVATTSSWKDNTKPVWPTDSQPVEVIALYPALTTLPTELSDDETYLMHYSKADKDKKPASFTMKHLMAKLTVKIFISEQKEHIPVDGVIQLRRKGKINYDGLTETPAYLKADGYPVETVSLGTFTETSAATGLYEFCNNAMIVVPQTFKAGTECLTFKVEKVTYVFKPSTDITLTPGVENILNLGITYTEPEEDEESGTGGELILPIVQIGGVVVSDWVEKSGISGGEAVEQ